MQKSAGVAETFGVSMEKLIGYSTAMGEVSREQGNQLGNRLKTVLSRITTMDESVTALAEIGIDTKIGDEVRDVGDILDDLGGKWHDLSKEQQQHIAVQLAGRHQLSGFTILMENYERALEATETATNSNGSAMQENERYLDSYEAKINHVKNAWTETTISMQEQFLGDGILAFTDIATSGINIITDLIDKVGLLAPVFGLAGLGVSRFTKNIELLTLSGIGKWIQGIIASMRTLDGSLVANTAKWTAWRASATAATAATKLLGGAWKFLNTALLPMAAMTAVGWGISKLTEKFSENRQEAEALKKEIEELQKKDQEALSDNSHETEELLDKYYDMKDRRDSGENFDLESEKEYLRIQNDLAEIFPSTIKYIDEKGQAHLRSKEEIDREIEATNELLEAERKLRIAEAQDTYEEDFNKAESHRKAIESLEDSRVKYEVAYDDNPNDLEYRKKMKKEMDAIDAEIQQENANLNVVLGELSQNVVDVFYDMISDLGEIEPELEEIFVDIFSGMSFEELNSEEMVEKATVELTSFMNNLNTLFESGDVEGFDFTVKALNQSLENFGLDEVELDFESFSQAVESGITLNELAAMSSGELEEALDDVGDSADEASNEIQAFNDAVDEIEQLNSFLNELDSDEGLSADSIGTMLENYPELLMYMDDEIALRKAIEDAIESEAQTAEEKVEQELMLNEDFYNATLEGNETLYNYLADMYGEDLGNFQSLADAKAQTEQKLINELAGAWAKYYRITADGLAEIDHLETSSINEDNPFSKFLPSSTGMMAQKQLSGTKDEINKELKGMQNAFESVDFNIGTDFSQIGDSVRSAGRDADKAGDKSKKANEKAKKGTEDTAKEHKLSKYVADEYANSLELVNSQLERQEAITKKFPTHSKEYRDSLKKEISLLKEKSGVLDKQSKDLEKQIKSGNIKDYGVVDAGSLWEYTPGTPGSVSGGGGSSGDIAKYYLDNFRVTSGFGGRNSPGGVGSTNHKGLDLANGKAGDPVKALASGKVIHAAYSGGAGNMVTIQQDDGLVSKYMHMQNGLKVKKGQQVNAGTILGGVGSTGNSTGNHVHLQLERDGTPFDPHPYLKQLKSGGGGSTSTGVPNRYSGKYAKEINAATSKHGLDPNLIAAIIKQESNFNNNVTSHAGAQGLMQLMPGTAKSLGVKNPFNAKQNIEGGTKYIAQQLKAFDGNLDKALAAYNAGPGNVKKHGGIPPFKETQDYVKKVSADYKKRGGNASSAQLQADASKDAANQAQAIDQAKSDLLGMQDEMAQIGDEIEELYFAIVESHLEQFDHERSKLDKKLAEIDYRQTWHDEESNAWARQQIEREKVLAEQNKIHKDSIKWLEREIKANKNLTKGQKMRLDDKLIERQQEMWELEKTILDERVNMAQQLIDVYKESLQAHKDAALKSVDNIIKEIDEKEKERDYKKRLEKEQKSRQEILDEMSELSIDDSDKAKKRIKELTEDLQDIDESIDDMQHDKQIDDRKEALEEEKEDINERYDNLIEDEKKFANMRSDIIKGNTKSVQKDLNEFYKKLGSMTDELGKSTVKNLQRSINQMNTYIKDSGFKGMEIPHFDTGGRVKASSSGGMIMAHDKEIVLNEKDSKNFLEAVKLSKNLVGDIKLPKMPDAPKSNVNTDNSNKYDINVHIEKVEGGQKGVDRIFKSIENKVKSRGGRLA